MDEYAKSVCTNKKVTVPISAYFSSLLSFRLVWLTSGNYSLAAEWRWQRRPAIILLTTRVFLTSWFFIARCRRASTCVCVRTRQSFLLWDSKKMNNMCVCSWALRYSHKHDNADVSEFSWTWLCVQNALFFKLLRLGRAHRLNFFVQRKPFLC